MLLLVFSAATITIREGWCSQQGAADF